MYHLILVEGSRTFSISRGNPHQGGRGVTPTNPKKRFLPQKTPKTPLKKPQTHQIHQQNFT